MTSSINHDYIQRVTSRTDVNIAKIVAVTAILLLGAYSLVFLSFGAEITSLRRMLGYPLGALANILLIWVGICAWRHNSAYAPSALRWLLILLIAWGGVLILRSFDITMTRIRDLFGTYWGAVCYLVPFLAYCGLRANFWPVFCRYGIYFLIVGILCVGLQDIWFMGHGVSFEFYLHHILFLAPLFYLGGFLFGKKYIYLGAAGLLVWLVNAFFIDKREDIALIGWWFLCSLLMMRKSSVLTFRDKVIYSCLIGVLISLGALIGGHRLYHAIATKSLDSRVRTFFYGGGATEDTRTAIVEDFFDDMNIRDILIGRGAVATYRTHISVLGLKHLGGFHRPHIEVGHLYHMLTGGIVQILLFNSIALGAVFLGLRRSRNRFTHVLAYIVAVWVLMMLITAIPFGELRYFLVWLAIGGCLSTQLRRMSTSEFVQMWHQLYAKNTLAR